LDNYDEDSIMFIKNKKHFVRNMKPENTDRYFYVYADTVILTTI
jgi:hypothetical protein